MKPIRVLFICHGNICRSVMAEYMFKKYVSEKGLKDQYIIKSGAVSSEEIGNDIYPAAKRCLTAHHVEFQRHYAHKITKEEYDEFDYIIAMDRSNINRLNSMFIDKDKKISMLLNRDVADPWYTDDFETTYKDIKYGIELLFKRINSIS